MSLFRKILKMTGLKAPRHAPAKKAPARSARVKRIDELMVNFDRGMSKKEHDELDRLLAEEAEAQGIDTSPIWFQEGNIVATQSGSRYRLGKRDTTRHPNRFGSFAEAANAGAARSTHPWSKVPAHPHIQWMVGVPGVARSVAKRATFNEAVAEAKRVAHDRRKTVHVIPLLFDDSAASLLLHGNDLKEFQHDPDGALPRVSVDPAGNVR
jgi:hypothetical protein